MDAQGIVAIIGALAAGIVLIIGARGKQRSAASSAPQPTDEQIAEVPEDPAGQREFMALLQGDNRDLRRELASLRTAVSEMRADLEADKDWKTHFFAALVRWLGKIARDYSARGMQMPLPDDDDLILLQEVVPRG